MLKTAAMLLVELMVLRDDIDKVLEYLGKCGAFQLRRDTDDAPAGAEDDPCAEILERLEDARTYLQIEDLSEYTRQAKLPSDLDESAARALLREIGALREKENAARERQKRVAAAYEEASAFANLKASYADLEHLTFLTLRIGKIDPAVVDDLKLALGDRAAIIPLGDGGDKILAAASKKGRFALDAELNKRGFIALETPKDFKGVPADVLESLKTETEEHSKALAAIVEERKKFAADHKDELLSYLQMFSLSVNVHKIRGSLESTQLVYRITGWTPADKTDEILRALDDLTEGRVAVCTYKPDETPTVKSGREKTPVKLNHGSFVRSFERMVFSYGAPLYGTIDPTPFVAVFFTLLFGIMFGDVGQGLVFVIIGVLLINKKISALHNWWKFGPIFIAIGCTSAIMGFLTGEFFTNGETLIPVSRFITGLFGEPKDHILRLMPQRGAMDKLLAFFGFTLGVGFIINSAGLIVNIVNKFILKQKAGALFGRTGLCGLLFFWYVVYAAIRIAFFKIPFYWLDAVCLIAFLLGICFEKPLERLFERKRPIFENGLFAFVIEGIVEILETVSTLISNSVSFVRVGAFALSHAVLSFIIFTLTDMLGGSLSVGGILVTIAGNAIIIVLEGMIVAIQVIRLQYYEFFSKFFTETGAEFTPLQFHYKKE